MKKNWRKLTDMKCPLCGSSLFAMPAHYYCGNTVATGCRFKIAVIEFDRIVADIYKKRSRRNEYDSMADNSEALNNL